MGDGVSMLSTDMAVTRALVEALEHAEPVTCSNGAKHYVTTATRALGQGAFITAAYLAELLKTRGAALAMVHGVAIPAMRALAERLDGQDEDDVETELETSRRTDGTGGVVYRPDGNGGLGVAGPETLHGAIALRHEKDKAEKRNFREEARERLQQRANNSASDDTGSAFSAQSAPPSRSPTLRPVSTFDVPLSPEQN